MVFVVFCGRSKVNDLKFCAQRVMISLGASVIFTNLKVIPLKQDIFGFEISVSVANAMDEGKGVEDLVEKLFDDFAWKAFVLVFFNNLIQ